MIRVDTEAQEDNVEIWTEPGEGDIGVGRCIGVGATLEEAKADARKELEADLKALDEL